MHASLFGAFYQGLGRRAWWRVVVNPITTNLREGRQRDLGTMTHDAPAWICPLENFDDIVIPFQFSCKGDTDEHD
jgi:hypothetical protein